MFEIGAIIAAIFVKYNLLLRNTAVCLDLQHLLSGSSNYNEEDKPIWFCDVSLQWWRINKVLG